MQICANGVQSVLVLFFHRAPLPSPKPWRKRPAAFLRYWVGKPDPRGEVKSILVYCVGGSGKKCGHSAKLKITDLQPWTWAEISAHVRRTECGAIGWVDLRADWPRVPMGTGAAHYKP